MSYARPYKGIRVVDMSQAVAGPYCGSILARLGADVVKVEPERGDWGRTVGKSYPGGHTIASVLANLGKRSICLDLKNKKGCEVLRELLKGADVFIESFRPGVSERLGFGYEAVSAINPEIIYLSVSGFGQQGPYSERPGTDGVMQAFSGFMTSNKGFDGLPHRANLVLIDLSAALYNVQAIQAALWARQTEITGRYIDNSLLETAAAFQNLNLASQATQGTTPQPLAYPGGAYKTSDGYVMVSVLFDREYKPFMNMLGLVELAAVPGMETGSSRFKKRTLIDEPISQAISHMRTDDLCEKLQSLRMLHERVNSYADFMQHAHTEQTGTLFWHEYPGIGRIPIANIPGAEKLGSDPAMLRSPELGEHTAMILAEMGYAAGDINALEDAGAINCKLAKQVIA
ncbi:MAG: CoA transferase [Pseudomonadales bacterium]|nr:CoA transferase [Pseudomonadales bacterium]